jgi:hypothetical protein
MTSVQRRASTGNLGSSNGCQRHPHANEPPPLSALRLPLSKLRTPNSPLRTHLPLPRKSSAPGTPPSTATTPPRTIQRVGYAAFAGDYWRQFFDPPRNVVYSQHGSANVAKSQHGRDRFSRSLKNGDWLRSLPGNPWEFTCREVPVPLFQRLAKGLSFRAARVATRGSRQGLPSCNSLLR